MTVSNFLKNKNSYTITEARELIIKEALGRNTLESINEFEKHYEQVFRDYYSIPKFHMSSVSFEIAEVESFKLWLNELKQSESIYRYMPFIVAKMLDGDSLAHSIFNEVYKALEKDDLLFSPQTFINHPELKIGLANSDAGADSQAIVNAEHWINSKEGKEILCYNPAYQSEIESLIGEICYTNSHN